MAEHEMNGNSVWDIEVRYQSMMRRKRMFLLVKKACEDWPGKFKGRVKILSDCCPRVRGSALGTQ